VTLREKVFPHDPQPVFPTSPFLTAASLEFPPAKRQQESCCDRIILPHPHRSVDMGKREGYLANKVFPEQNIFIAATAAKYTLSPHDFIRTKRMLSCFPLNTPRKKQSPLSHTTSFPPWKSVCVSHRLLRRREHKGGKAIHHHPKHQGMEPLSRFSPMRKKRFPCHSKVKIQRIRILRIKKPA